MSPEFPAAGVGAGLGSAAGSALKVSSLSADMSAGNIVRNVAANAAGSIAASAAESLVTGRDFGDTIMANLPGMIANTVGSLVEGVIAGRGEKARAQQQIDNLSSTDKDYLQAHGVELAATRNGVKVTNLSQALGALEADQKAGIVRTGEDSGFQNIDGQRDYLDTSPAPWQSDKTDGGGLTYSYDGAKGGVTSRWLTVGDGGAIRFVTRGDSTFLYSGGTQRFDEIGLSISFGTRPEPIQQTNLNQVIFNGKSFQYYNLSGEKVILNAVSGRPGFQTSEYQTFKKLGPIPEGIYIAKQSRSQTITPLDAALGTLPIGSWPGGLKSWGFQRVWLQPVSSTKVYGRSGFSIHGGQYPGSAGCIDLTDNMGKFYRDFKSAGHDIKIIVDYKK